MNTLELHTVVSDLDNGPAVIEEAAKAVVEASVALDTAKRSVEKARALAIINNQDAKNQTILNALVDNDGAVAAAENEVIIRKGKYLGAVAVHEKAKDEFDAAKKKANLLESEMRSLPYSGSPRS